MIIQDLYKLSIQEARNQIIERVKDEFQNMERYAKDISNPDEICLSMARDTAKVRPIIHCSVYLRDECSPSFEHVLSLDKFLDETKKNYSGSGIDGWGVAMIDDLKLLQSKIAKRIKAMEKAIDEED